MTKRIVAIASAGGHWQQLMLLRPAYAHHNVTYLTTLDGLAENYEARPSRKIPDCNRNTPGRLVLCTLALFWQLLRIRPHVIITTGAMPGLIALTLGRVFFARTVWVDSLANAETLSDSGRYAGRVAHLRLSQWQNVAEAEGTEFAGRLL